MRFILPTLVAATLLGVGSTLSAQLPIPDPQTVATDTVKDLAARRFSVVEKRFDDRVQSALPADKLAAVWDALIDKAGPFESVLGSHVDEQGAFHSVRVACKFKYESFDLQFAINDRGRIAGMHVLPPSNPSTSSSEQKQSWTAPSYVKPSSFHEVDVTVESGRFKLPGTLTLPNGKGPFPAIVLVQGSGPHDADETIGDNKPFKDLAWGLASQNIAVLRYMKRTKQYGAESVPPGVNLTVKQEVTEDADTAVALLASRPEIDAKQIYVLGHSLGGMLAPRIAAGDKQVAGIIIAAGTARPIEVVIVDQLKYISSLPGANQQELRPQVDAAEKAKTEIESPGLKPDAMISVIGTMIPASYFLDLRDYHPAEVAAKLNIPILVLQGGHDYQVTKDDYQLWQAALGNDPRATFKFYPGLTHLFMDVHRPGPASPADYSVAGHVSVEVVNDVAQWVNKNAAGK
jgi:dienelactone hydrolase